MPDKNSYRDEIFSRKTKTGSAAKELSSWNQAGAGLSWEWTMVEKEQAPKKDLAAIEMRPWKANLDWGSELWTQIEWSSFGDAKRETKTEREHQRPDRWRWMKGGNHKQRELELARM
jgi:hypothetical protein